MRMLFKVNENTSMLIAFSVQNLSYTIYTLFQDLHQGKNYRDGGKRGILKV